VSTERGKWEEVEKGKIQRTGEIGNIQLLQNLWLGNVRAGRKRQRKKSDSCLTNTNTNTESEGNPNNNLIMRQAGRNRLGKTM
jgi:hypothetical protein